MYVTCLDLEGVLVPEIWIAFAEAAGIAELKTIASGDSYNDLGMIEAGKAGFLFRTTPQIRKDHPDIPAFEAYDDLLCAIKGAMEIR